MKKIIAVLSACLVCAGAGAQILDPGNRHYYQVIVDPGATWLSAEVDALSRHYLGLEGHLATVTGAQEDSFVGAAVTAYGGSSEFWLGGYQVPSGETDPTAGWTWVNGEGSFPGVNGASGFANPYSNWNSGEPNDYYGVASEQYLGINLGNVGGFNDEGNLGLIGGYVIEYDPNTDPTGGLVPDGGTTAALLTASFGALGLVSRRLRR